MRRALSLAVLALVTAAPSAAASPWMDASRTPDDRATLLLVAMTLPEKLDLVHGHTLCEGPGAEGFVRGNIRLGIPDLTFHGAGAGVANGCHRDNLRLANPNVARATTTELPAPVARAASWDPDLAYRAGALLGRETRGLGFNVAIGGAVNIVRDPRVGRAFETFGEDPYLSGRLITSEQRAVGDQGVVNSIKHYAANNEENSRYTSSSNVDERTLREIYLPAFEAAVRGTEIGSVMCAYNRVNQVQACENHHLLQEILKDEWGFDGWVMSDWLVGTRSTVDAALAGLDQEQPVGVFFGPPLTAAVVAGKVPMERINDMAFRILRTMFAFGLFDSPPVNRGIDVRAGAREAQEIEEQSAVLLKNDGPILPLDPAGTRSVAVIGAHADGSPDGRASTAFLPQVPGTAERASTGYPSGAGSSLVWPAAPVAPLDGIKARVPDADVRYDGGEQPARAAELARRSDVAIVFARDSQAEGGDRKTLALDDGADALIAAVVAANPRTVVVLETGGAVTMPWVSAVPAILEAWYPGESAGTAIARLLFGDVNPSGRLPITFPAREADLPTAGSPKQWPGVDNQVDYSEGVFVGYRWYDEKGIEPLFPFGHGLAYGGRFRYGKLRVTPRAGGGATVRFRVRNVGRRRGAEVAQVYVGSPDPSSMVTQPPRILRQFAKLELDPGEARTVRLALDERAFSYWDVDRDGWAVAPGCYRVLVGASSRGIRLRARLPAGGGSCG